MSNTVKLPTCPKCHAPIPAEAPQGLCPRCVLLGAATATEQGVPATATSEIPSLERIAAAFPQLEVLELIGRGGMGFVFKARQPHLDRFVALKLLPDKLAKDALFAERFNREGRVLARLNHPNIVSVYDFGQAGGFYYLAMEYVDGVNLRQAMRAGRFSPAEALALVPKVCEALQYAHEQGILHRDIKPENILLDTKGRVKIADFGIAKLVGEDQTSVTLTNTGAALGTPHYMAPEQFEKPATVDHRADIYSLGVVFYELLTGELPIGRFAAPSSKTPVNSTVDDVVFRTLEKDRERRFQSAGEMKTQVEHLGEGTNAAPPAAAEKPASAPPALPAPAWMKRLGVLFCLLGGVALLPTLLSLGSNMHVYHSGMFLAFTGVALLTRNGQWRMAAIVANVIGLVMPLASVISVMFLSRNGTLPPGWSLGIPGLVDSAGLGIALALVQTVAFAIGLWALLRPAAKPHFLAAPYVPVGRVYSWWVISGTALVGMSLPQPLSMIGSILAGRSGFGPADFWAALSNVAMPGLGGTLIGWLALNKIRESGGRERGLPLALFATLTWPLILLSALTVGLPMLLVTRGEPTLENMFGRFLVLLLPAGVIGFGFWLVQATKRWANQKPAPHERGILRWSFIVVLIIGMGAVMVFKPSRHEVSLPPAPNGKSVALPPVAKTKVVELSLHKNHPGSIFLTTTSPLGPDEALVPIFERPDGSREMGQFLTHFSRDNNRTQERATAVWRWAGDGSYPPEEAKRIETLLEENFVGRPLTLVAGQPLHLFSLANRAGGVLRCHLDYQPDFAENAYRSTESDQAMVRVEQGIVSSGSRSTLILFLKPSIPPGHSLQPICNGTIGTSGSTERTISQSSGYASFTCNWSFPASFTSNDVFAAQAQCDTLRQSPPFPIPSGGRQLLFAVTNQAGEVHRGYLELVKPAASLAVTRSTELDEADEIRIRLAREQFKEAKQMTEAGAGSQQFLADAERRLAIAEARGDAVAVARANLKFADQALRAAKENFEAGVVSAPALRIAESEQAIAELDLKAALKSTKATPK